jgi:hypothetical protein
MEGRSLLESRIAESLARLSAEDMQRVAEDYARIRFPGRFPRFHFRAFSEKGKSRKGWPDAWTNIDGRIDGVEATSAVAWSAVRNHIEKDLKHARDRSPRLSGLIIVSGNPAAQPNATELEALRKRFVDEAHIDPDRLEFVFGGGLVEELARPEFARTRIEVLRLADAPLHFALIRARRSPDEGRLDSAFIPTEEDYEARRVYRPAATEEVLAHLERSGRALVRGVGASGKTVLAWLLGLEAAEQRRPAYYLDFANDAQMTAGIANELIEDIRRFAHPDSLFVLDNCHLDEAVAKEVALGWEQIYQSQRPKLLLVGRELRTARGSPIDGLSIPTIPLRARQPEVLGVYRRLAGRHGDASEPPLPPPDALDDWVRTFGGDPQSEETTTDLIAFSAAVLRRMPQLLRHQWTLTAQDAIEEVREVYLNELALGETQNLILLCACQEVELALAEEALPDRHEALRKSTQQLGLVFRSQAGRSSSWVRYRLAHAALGSLILAAVRSPVDKSALRIEASLRNPHTGSMMVSHLAAVGLEDEGRQVADQMLARPECLIDIGSLNWVQSFLRQVDHLGVFLPRDIGIALASDANRKQLLKRALETPLDALGNFLSYAGKTEELKGVYDALAADLAKKENRERLQKRALETPLADLASFLSYAAKTKELKGIYAALTADLGKEENVMQLVKRAPETPLNDLAYFLSYARKTEELRGVYAALAADLAKEENVKQLVKRALETPLNALANFLGYARKTEELKGVYAALAAHLAKEENRRQLVKHALETPLDALGNFLGYAANTKELEGVYNVLAVELANPDNRRVLAAAMETQPLDAVVSFLSSEVFHDLCVAIADIDLERWARARRAEVTPKLDAFVSFQRIVEQNGRPELSEAPAQRLIVSSTPMDWHQPAIGLHHLSHVLRLARGVSSEEIERFLDRVATPLWVDGLLLSAPTGGLAGSLLSLASSLDPGKHRWFLRGALLKRVSLELRSWSLSDPGSCAQALSLLGSVFALGVSLPRVNAEWPDASELAEVLELRAPDLDRTTIGHIQVQLWLGLHEMARLRADAVLVPQPEADRILDLWIATQECENDSLLPHVCARNLDMIAWLQKCKAANWRLVPPH